MGLICKLDKCLYIEPFSDFCDISMYMYVCVAGGGMTMVGRVWCNVTFRCTCLCLVWHM